MRFRRHGAAAAGRAIPSIAGRLARALLGWSLAWGAAAGGAVWLAAAEEVDELLDETLVSSAELLAAVVRNHDDSVGAVLPDAAVAHFAWQLVGPGGTVLLRSPRAPATAWQPVSTAGFHDQPGWRIYGLATGNQGGVLYAAQTTDERNEARHEVGLSALLAALAVGALGHIWLRARVRQELVPLTGLSAQLATWDPAGRTAPVLGPAERAELLPVHDALNALAERLAARLANERAFAAHAAHALRTPLAGIDAQLAVAAREAGAGPLAERLQRVRGAAARLQAVVAALLALFRSADGAAALQRQPLQLREWAARLPVSGPALQASGSLQADPDLLAAVLVNLVDNAARAGAHNVTLSVAGDVLSVQDDGAGLSPERRQALREALQASGSGEPERDPAGKAGLGLGLLLADRVARVHGGELRLPDTAQGFRVDLRLSPGPPPGSG
jgi:two-component system sensor histidine kinase TctE